MFYLRGDRGDLSDRGNATTATQARAAAYAIERHTRQSYERRYTVNVTRGSEWGTGDTSPPTTQYVVG